MDSHFLWFQNRTNFHTPFFCGKFVLFAILLEKPRPSLLKKYFAPPGLRLFLIFHWQLFVLWSQWHGHRPRVIRCSKPSHSFCFFLFSCFHWFFFFFSTMFFVFFCVLCSFFVIIVFSSLCFVSWPFSKLFLFQLFFSWSPLALLFFSTSSSSIYFWNSFCKNLSLLLFSLVPFFEYFFVRLSFLSRLFSFFLLFTYFLWTSSGQNRLLLSVSFPSFFDSLFWSLSFDPFDFFEK